MNKSGKNKRVNEIEEDSESENSDFEIGSIEMEKTNELQVNALCGDEWMANLNINGVPITIKLDTGAECNVLPQWAVKKVGGELITSATRRLITFNKSKVNVIGEIRVECTNKEDTEWVIFKVVKESYQPILGKKMCAKLGFVKRIYGIDSENMNNGEFGCCNSFTYDIDFIDNPLFKIIPPRKIPHAIRDDVKKELDRMVELGVIVPVSEPSPAVSPMLVVNRDSKLRICMDPTELNKNIKRRHYPLKTVEEVAAKLCGAKCFSKLDCEKGFWQIKVTDETSKYLAISTPWGRYRYLRLPFGISPAPEVFSEIMNKTLENIEGCEVVMDDIFIYAKNEAKLNDITKIVLKRLKGAGFTLNQEKCEFNKTQIKFLGHVFSPDGCTPDKSKVEAIDQIKTPTNVKEVQRFLGMVNYIGKFVKNLSDLTEPLRRLNQKNAEWHWDTDQEEAFNKIKEVIKEAPVLEYYDVNKPVKLSVDASKAAMGCCLMQNNRPIAYATRAFNLNQQNYPQIVKEAMAIRFGCQKFHEYVFGKELTIETDHQPLETIFKKPITNAPMRLQKILWDVLQYSPSVKYIKGTKIPVADTLSRDCKIIETEKAEEYQINVILSISDEAIKRYTSATRDDPELQLLKSVLENGWPNEANLIPDAIKPYVTFRHELTYENDLLFKGDRIIVPRGEIQKILKDLHIGHPGISSMLSRARQSAYWIGQTGDIKNHVEKCTVCQQTQRANTKEPALMKKVPDFPFQLVSSDLFKFRGGDFILIADHYSGFTDFRKLKTTTSEEVILVLRQWFSVHGIPEIFESDGGPQYSSNKFKEFAREWKFEHRLSSPHYPRSNGFAERNVQTVKNLLKKCYLDGSDPYLAMLLLRNTDRNGVLKSPAQRLFSRTTRSIIPVDRKKLHPRIVQNVTEEMTNLRMIQKKYFDRISKPVEPLKTGEVVRMQTGHREWITGTVTNNTQFPRSVMVQTDGGATYRRNNSHLHRTKATIRRPNPLWPKSSTNEPNPDNQQTIYGDNQIEPPDAPGGGDDTPSFEPPDVPGGNVSAGDQPTQSGGNQQPNQAADSTNNRVSRSGRIIRPTEKYAASFNNKKY